MLGGNALLRAASDTHFVDSIAHSEGDGEVAVTPFGAVLHNTPRQMDIDTLRAYRNAIESAICAYTSYHETGRFENE